jgi:hypothetical protein
MEPVTGTHPSGAISMSIKAFIKREASFLTSGIPLILG